VPTWWYHGHALESVGTSRILEARSLWTDIHCADVMIPRPCPGERWHVRVSLCPRDDTTAMPWRAWVRWDFWKARSLWTVIHCAHVMIPRLSPGERWHVGISVAPVWKRWASLRPRDATTVCPGESVGTSGNLGWSVRSVILDCSVPKNWILSCLRDDTTAMPWRAWERREFLKAWSQWTDIHCAHVMIPRQCPGERWHVGVSLCPRDDTTARPWRAWEHLEFWKLDPCEQIFIVPTWWYHGYALESVGTSESRCAHVMIPRPCPGKRGNIENSGSSVPMNGHSLCRRDDTTAMPWRALGRQSLVVPTWWYHGHALESVGTLRILEARSLWTDIHCAHVMIPRLCPGERWHVENLGCPGLEEMILVAPTWCYHGLPWRERWDVGEPRMIG